MDREMIMDTMKNYGFTFNMESRDGKGKTTAFYFMSEPVYHRRRTDLMTVPPYSCIVYPDTDEFVLTYVVPGSINSLVTPKCSPVSSDEQFNRISMKFESAVQVLYQAFKQ